MTNKTEIFQKVEQRYLPAAFFVFEGIDGSGKTTQVHLVKEGLEKMGYRVVATREPGGTTFGEMIKEIIHSNGDISKEARLGLLLAARAEHVRNVLEPVLSKRHNVPTVVLCDRFDLSTIAYQGAAGVDMKTIELLNTTAKQGIKTPDMTLTFLLHPKKAFQRSVARDNNPSVFEKKATFMERVSQIYKNATTNSKIAKQFELGYIRQFDADRSVDVIHKDVMDAIVERLKVLGLPLPAEMERDRDRKNLSTLFLPNKEMKVTNAYSPHIVHPKIQKDNERC